MWVAGGANVVVAQVIWAMKGREGGELVENETVGINAIVQADEVGGRISLT